MIICYKDLNNIQDEKVYEFFEKEIVIQNNPFIRRIEDADGYFIFYYEGDTLKIEYRIKGKMICPDCYTLEDVEVEFDESETEDAVTDMESEGILLETKSDVQDLIKQIILPIVPIKVAKNQKIGYSNGCDWTVVKEEDFKVTDPRLEAFKNLLNEEDKDGCSTEKK